MIMQCVPCYMFILNMKFNFFSFASGTRKSKGYLPLKVCLRSMEEQKKTHYFRYSQLVDSEFYNNHNKTLTKYITVGRESSTNAQKSRQHGR